MRDRWSIIRRDDGLMGMRSPWVIRAMAAFIAMAFVVAVALIVDRCVPAAWAERLVSALAALQATNATTVAAATIWALFVAATCVGCPINLCIAACMLALMPARGFAVAFAGTLASAAILHALGSMVSVRRSARWFRKRAALRRALRRSVVAVALARLVPVAPYAVVSLFAGAMRVPRGRYLAGTALGMTPGIAIYAMFVDRAEAVLRGAHAPMMLAAMAAVVLVAVVWIASERRFRRGDVPR